MTVLRGSATESYHREDGSVESRPVELTSLYDDLAGHHQAPRTDVLTNEVVRAGDEVAAVLAVKPGSQTVVRRAVYKAVLQAFRENGIRAVPKPLTGDPVAAS